MKAVIVEQLGPIENARYMDAPDPVPGPGQVVVDVKAIEANFPDFLVMEGKYQIKPPLPFSPGKAAAGTVSGLGDGVSHLEIGDRVGVQVEYGAYAEKLLAPAKTCYRMPEAMPFETSAALGLVYQTAHFALVDRARIQPGDRVLVLGASGGIGSAACQLAKALGASVVIGGVLGADNIATAKSVGCDHAIEMSGGDRRDRLRDEVRAVTDGQGADIVIDPVGGGAFTAALRALAWRGRLVVIGFASGTIPEVKANYLLIKNIEVSGLHWSDYRERDPAWVRRVQDEIYALWSEGRLKPLISEAVPLADYARALEMLRRGQVKGKIVLTTGA